jgi:anti-sigma-K factor RskA
MADLPSHPDFDDSGAHTGPRGSRGRPRWRSAALAVGVVVVLVVVIALHVTGVLGPSDH